MYYFFRSKDDKQNRWKMDRYRCNLAKDEQFNRPFPEECQYEERRVKRLKRDFAKIQKQLEL